MGKRDGGGGGGQTGGQPVWGLEGLVRHRRRRNARRVCLAARAACVFSTPTQPLPLPEPPAKRNTGNSQQQQQWPRISKKHGLKAQRLVGEHVFVVPGVMTTAEAQRWVDAAEAAGFEHQGSRGAAYGEAFRDNHRLSFSDAALAQHLWEAGGLKPLFEGISVAGAGAEERAVGLNANIRLYRYASAQRFGRHIDDSVEVGPGRATRYTLLIYLSGPSEDGGGGGDAGSRADEQQQQQQQQAAGGGGGGRPKRAGAGAKMAAAAGARAGGAAAAAPCARAVQPLRGGETVFYGDRGRVLASVAPRPGLALLHLHGEDRCLEHEGAAVVAGTKYVLRSDVVFERVGGG